MVAKKKLNNNPNGMPKEKSSEKKINECLWSGRNVVEWSTLPLWGENIYRQEQSSTYFCPSEKEAR